MTGCRNHYPRWVRCSYCDDLVLTSGSRATCPECKREQVIKQQHIRAMKYVPKENMTSYIVVYDPIPVCEGGFNVGARIGREEMKDMLMPSICAFRVGTIVRTTSGEIFTVMYRKGGGLKLVVT